MVQLQPTPNAYRLLVSKETILDTISAGQRYSIGCQDISVLNSIHGVIGGYRLNAQCAEIIPLSSITPTITATGQLLPCYFWDASVDLSRLEDDLIVGAKDQIKPLNRPLKKSRIKANRLVQNLATLNGPQLSVHNEVTMLSLSPRFDFTFSTDDYAAQIGVINLVQSNRFIRLENNNEINLLDTSVEDTPVLYLENPQDDQPIKYVSAQQKLGVTSEHSFDFTISQAIPDSVGDEKVETVTVLEQYCSYFMQRAVLNGDQSIWTPVYAPITWGWSIRVGRRTDGEWGILRRKLILPTTGNDGLHLPEWRSNTLNCS